MTVKEIIVKAAELLGLSDLVEGYFSSGSEDGKKAVDALVGCYNLVESELAIDYLPLVCEDEVKTDTGAVYFTKLRKNASRILSVCDQNGNAVEWKLFPEYILAQAGKLVVRYAYAPTEKNLDDDGEYQSVASVRLFAYGVAAEYCLIAGLYEESAVWENKYRAAIQAAYKAKPSKVMKARRWV
ncbi:MAG: hypothetical protein IJX98_04995 [Clostridia bacterium]|nr:hypothetical protein [Clostridia bacterium]